MMIMQAATTSSFGLSALLPVKASSLRLGRVPRAAARIRRAATVGVRAAVEPAEVDYSSKTSVFPTEACDLIGGEACDGQMYPETKLDASATAASSSSSRAVAVAVAEDVEREYLTYDEPKTVFPDEACDDLGGEFCEAPYQAGVSKDLA